MTLETILRSVVGPSTSEQHEFPAGGHSSKFLSDRNDGEYYHFGGHYQKPKSKSKSDKKHAILSALSLLAFLFFLNILQTCIREQYPTTATIMMFNQKGKAPMSSDGLKAEEEQLKVKRSVASSAYETSLKEGEENEHKNTRKSRTLLQILENQPGKTLKIIRRSRNAKNWTNELSEVSEKDLEEQKLKTLNFPLYWKNNRVDRTDNNSTSEPMNEPTNEPKKEQENTQPAFIAKILSPALRRLKKRDKFTAGAESPDNKNRIQQLHMPTTEKLVWDYKDSSSRSPSSIYVLDNGFKVSNWFYNNSQGTLENTTVSEQVPVQKERNATSTTLYTISTPRSVPSDFSGIAQPVEYGDYGNSNDKELDEQAQRISTNTLDFQTYQTTSPHNYNNHRISGGLYNENYLAHFSTSEETPQPDLGNLYSDHRRMTTEMPSYYEKLGRPTPHASYPKKPFYGKAKYRNKYSVHHGYYQRRNEYPSRHKYLPNRRIGNQDPSYFHNHNDHYHETYYPVVLAKYPDDEDQDGFDIVKFLWTLLTSFAKPLTKLVPSFAKDNPEEPQCYDLLVCEAQRVSKFMGPTAEAFAATVGALITWASTEDTRQVVIDAIKSGKENTCLQQIKDCENRSGGKSAMTVIAQVLEVKLR